MVTSIVNNAKGSAIQTWVWIVEPASALDILAYYRGLGDDPGTVEYADIQKAIDDWISKTAPAGYAHSITYQELLSLIYQWV
ncbi:MAG: hypothetical protein MPEBLZ_04108 [Candidatus Methanoperedens nitroreducens]|uniref:Uncharacterized protein n=1 Tax=Candidatus Methanoperedens nitratireducens TaxID=1392998 RepID=A0A0P8A099_9EURY|nr:MAG: hypothetical protein MPEBLZ_04108 [Candidatus Methanoperedens sp. BLZ1]